MDVKSYISQRFNAFGIHLSEAELLDIWAKTEELTDDNKIDVQVAIVKFIPEMLLRPNVSEGGVSITYDKDALKDYYSMKCKEYGLMNELTPKPKITFL